MPSGGARARSGPAPDPRSGRSDSRGLSFVALPPEGYSGEVPDFPLPPSVMDGQVGPREREVWELVWNTPQAAVWARESWRWEQVALYCRLKALVEATPAASAALVTQILRIEDRIGLSDDGMKRNGWQIASTADDEDDKPKGGRSGSSRMRLIRGAAAG